MPAHADEKRRPLAAVILSGGESRRMGAAKALVPYRGKTFVEHLIEVTRHQRVGLTRIVVGAHADEIRDRLAAAHTSEIVVNADWAKGQLSSIQAAIRSLPDGTDGLILFLIDHPLISISLVNDLIEQFYATSCAKIVLPVFDTRRGHPVIFPAALYQELLQAPMDKGARAVVWAHAGDVLSLPTNEEGCVVNLNDPETMRRATGRSD